MKTPHQTQETAQISASNDRSMVGQGELDLFIEMSAAAQGDYSFPTWITDEFRELHWFDNLDIRRVTNGFIIFTKELVVWSICDLQGSVI